MPERLTECLVDRGLVSAEAAEEALERQVLMGGALDTALFELGLVDESAVLEAMAQTYELEVARASDASRAVDGRAVRALPEQWAKRHRIAPLGFAEDEKTLLVLSPAPADLQLIHRLAELLETPIRPLLAPEFRVEERLALLYGSEPDERHRALIATFGGRLPSSSWEDPSNSKTIDFAAAVARLRDPKSRDHIARTTLRHVGRDLEFVALFLVQDGFLDGWLGRGAGAENIRGTSIPVGPDSAFRVVLDTRAHYLGPLAADASHDDFVRSIGRPHPRSVLIIPLRIKERTIAVLYGENGQMEIPTRVAANVMLFVSHVQTAMLTLLLRRKATSFSQLPASDSIEMAAPFELEVISPRPADDSEPNIGPAAESGLGVGAALSFLGNRVPSESGSQSEFARANHELSEEGSEDREMSPEDEIFIEEVPSLEPSEESMLLRTSEEREGEAPADGGPDTIAMPLSAMSAPGFEESLTQVPAAPNGESSPDWDSVDLVEVDIQTSEELGLDADLSKASSDPGEDVWEPVELSATDAGSIEEQKNFRPEDELDPAILRGLDEAEAANESWDAVDASLWDDPRESEADDEREDELHLIPGRDSTVPDLSAEAWLKASEGAARQRSLPEEVLERAALPNQAQQAPRSEPAAESPADNDPAFVEEVNERLAQLEHPMKRVRGMAREALATMGTPALPILANRFPGPLSVNPFAPEVVLPAFADCGPLLSLVAHHGLEAHPHITPLLEASDPVVRFFATYFYSAVYVPDAVPRLVQRLHDEEGRICMTAARTLFGYRSHGAFEQVLEHLHGRLHASSIAARRHATFLLGLFRDVSAIPELIGVLERKERALSDVAETALAEITKQRLGSSARRWKAWWAKNQDRNRIEWLIEGLSSKDRAIRRSACEELRAVTGKSLDYEPDAPRRVREEARKQWLDWWQRDGVFRF